MTEIASIDRTADVEPCVEAVRRAGGRAIAEHLSAEGDGPGLAEHGQATEDVRRLLRGLHQPVQLQILNEGYNFDLLKPLIFKTDLHNTWWRNVSRPGDGYHELLEKQDWIYKLRGGKLLVNAPIDAIHQALEKPPEQIDQEFAIIRSMLPEELFAGE